MTRNVLEHVAAADPERSAAAPSEREAAERDAIRAMVLATELPPPSAAPPRRRRPPRRLGFALAAAVAACAAIAVALTVSGRDASFADRAYAAVTASGLFHVVEETTIDAPPVVFEHEPLEEWRPTRTESWYDRGDRASHFILSDRREGRFKTWYETAWNDGEQRVRDANGNVDEVEPLDEGGDASDAPAEYYALRLFEDAYRSDDVRDDGEVVLDGRRLRRLVLDIPAPPEAPGPSFGASRRVMLFDPATLYPVRLTETTSITIGNAEHPVTVTTHYRTFERLPDTPENRAKLELD